MKQLTSFPNVGDTITKDYWGIGKVGKVLTLPNNFNNFSLMVYDPFNNSTASEYHTWDDTWYLVKEADSNGQPAMRWAVMYETDTYKLILLSLHATMENANAYLDKYLKAGFPYADIYDMNIHKTFFLK